MLSCPTFLLVKSTKKADIETDAYFRQNNRERNIGAF